MPEAHEDLVLFKRHSEDCDVHKTRIPVANRRYWMECRCMTWIVGRTPDGDVVPRQSTGCRDTKDAQAFRQSLLKTKPNPERGPLLSECIEKYLEGRKSDLSEDTLEQTRLLLCRLQQYCEKNSVYYSRDLTVDLLETFKIKGLPSKLKDTSKATSVNKLRCFLRVAFRRDWIKEALAEKVTAHHALSEQAEPYTDEEVQKILAGALKPGRNRQGYSERPETFRVMLEVMLETGLLVSDVINLDPKAITRGPHMWVYKYTPIKTKNKKRNRGIIAEVYLSDRLKGAIDSCEWFSETKPFYYGAASTSSRGTSVWKALQAVGKRCGVEDCRAHRFRDTFAVRSLLKGMQLDDVSRLLAHSSVAVTERYYAKWIPARRDRLERLVSETLVNP